MGENVAPAGSDPFLRLIRGASDVIIRSEENRKILPVCIVQFSLVLRHSIASLFAITRSSFLLFAVVTVQCVFCVVRSALVIV
jgi:hypothetical protein